MGWPFIEEGSYTVLIDAILAKQQSSAQAKVNSCFISCWEHFFSLLFCLSFSVIVVLVSLFLTKNFLLVGHSLVGCLGCSVSVFAILILN